MERGREAVSRKEEQKEEKSLDDAPSIPSRKLCSLLRSEYGWSGSESGIVWVWIMIWVRKARKCRAVKIKVCAAAGNVSGNGAAADGVQFKRDNNFCQITELGRPEEADSAPVSSSVCLSTPEKEENEQQRLHLRLPFSITNASCNLDRIGL